MSAQNPPAGWGHVCAGRRGGRQVVRSSMGTVSVCGGAPGRHVALRSCMHDAHRPRLSNQQARPITAWRVASRRRDATRAATWPATCRRCLLHSPGLPTRPANVHAPPQRSPCQPPATSAARGSPARLPTVPPLCFGLLVLRARVGAFAQCSRHPPTR
jgi:hypothetical protein